MTTLFEALIDLAEIVDINKGVATAGSVTGMTDSLLSKPTYYFQGGTLLFISGNLANQAKDVLTSGSDGSFTFANSGSAAGNGDKYVAVSGKYTRYEMVSAVNAALREIRINASDTSLRGIASQEIYDLPAGVIDVRQIETSTTSGSAGFTPNYNWQVIGGQIFFDQGRMPVADSYIRLWYTKLPDEVNDESDTISDEINRQRLAWAAAYYLMVARLRRGGNEDSGAKKLIDEAEKNKSVYALRFPVRLRPKAVKLPNW